MIHVVRHYGICDNPDLEALAMVMMPQHAPSDQIYYYHETLVIG
jgi:hypothetical protein